MKKRFLYPVLSLTALVFELLPYGAVCNFARPATDGSIGHFRELYSYFDLIPFGYANFAPFLTAMLTCIVFALSVVYCVTGKRGIAKVLRTLLGAATVLSLGPLLLGFRFFSVVGACITVTLLATFLILYFELKAEKRH